ncbi:hypothetical protein [Singulisphaera sp. PoT]|uniref:hypothetical protein n=1 Tax=Singulisphaera sp. PoT TaxID=3411797 RepID=UPI003BF4EBD0
MDLDLESGRKIHQATEDDILAYVEGEDFAILSQDEDSYMQCAEQHEPPYEYLLEYQDRSIEQHYRATDEPISLDRVLSAFLKYKRGDESWREDFQWEKMDLSQGG